MRQPAGGGDKLGESRAIATLQQFDDLRDLGSAARRRWCYVTSQKHEGWTVLATLYDDGAYSGGTMDRPALQRLLDDVRTGKIDVVVVYKVDRLTRSLADFAKIVEVFDAQGVSCRSEDRHAGGPRTGG